MNPKKEDSKKMIRLSIALTQRKLVASRSQAENLIKLGKVTVDDRVVLNPSYFVGLNNDIKLLAEVQYVSRAGLKLASVADILKLSFKDKVVLDVGSSTGGFTDYALRHGAEKIYAIDVGTEQLHPSLRGNKRIELHEKTDIRDFTLASMPDIIVIDVSFISLRKILPHIFNSLSDSKTQIVVMVKPQFEVGYVDMPHAEQGRSTVKTNPSTRSTSSGLFSNQRLLNKGVIKNDAMRRKILRDFEDWSKEYFVIIDKRDSDVTGAKGNQERFYLLRTINRG